MTLVRQSPLRCAAIDVGTNSVKLLVADLRGNTINPVIECACQTRLGSDFYPAKRLARGAVVRTADTVADFASKARGLGAARIRVIATSAARDASNAAELISAIRSSAGLETEILSGDEEARLAFIGVASEARLADKTILLVEVGRGSTQLIIGHARTVLFIDSLPLGAVRLLEFVPPKELPANADRERCQEAVRSILNGGAVRELHEALASATDHPEAVTSGGTASVLGAMQLKLARFDRERIESVVLTRSDLSRWLDRLWSIPLVERRKTPGLPSERADVILTGTAILAGVMESLGLTTMRISTRGLRFGALAD